jgi:hypothetical protein
MLSLYISHGYIFLLSSHINHTYHTVQIQKCIVIQFKLLGSIKLRTSYFLEYNWEHFNHQTDQEQIIQ